MKLFGMALHKLTLSIGLLAASLMLAATAHGTNMRSDFFVSACQRNENLCTMYVVGYLDGMKDGVVLLNVVSSGMAPEEQDGKFWRQVSGLVSKIETIGLGCWPEKGLGNGQMVKIWLKYLDDNPAKLHEPPNFTFPKSLREAFPCK